MDDGLKKIMKPLPSRRFVVVFVALVLFALSGLALGVGVVEVVSVVVMFCMVGGLVAKYLGSLWGLRKRSGRRGWGGVSLCALVLLLCVSLFVPLVLGVWSESSSGSWTISTDTHWEASGSSSASLTYTQVVDLENWNFALDIWSLAGLYYYQNSVTHTVMVNLTNGATTVSVKIVQEDIGMVLWAGHGMKGWAYRSDGSSWAELWSDDINALEYVWCKKDFSFRLYFKNETSTLLKAWLVFLPVRDSDQRIGISAWNWTVPVNFCDGVTLTQYVSKVGDGEIVGYKDGEVFNGSVDEPYESEASEVWWLGAIWNALTSRIYDILPQFLRDIVDAAVDMLSPLGSLVSALWGSFYSILPMLPMIFVLYFFDVLLASAKSGSIEPLGLFSSRILGLITGLGHWLIAIAQAIWSVIKFW